MIIAISVDPPPIFVATRAGCKGISETPPILNPKRSAEYRRECYGTVGTLPARGMGLARLSTRRPEPFQMPLH